MQQKLYLFLCLGFMTLSCTPRKAAAPEVKNIILLIGDGMGVAQVSTRYYFKEDQEMTNFSRFKHIGLHQNSPVGAKVTDSAAGATAFACGKKSYNGAIGVDGDTVSIPTILEMLSEDNWSTGVIATSSITHATPASFYAHVKSRNMHEEIAKQLTYSSVDFFAGAGYSYFAQRSDSTDFMAELQKQGFTVDTTTLPSAPLALDKKYGYLLAPKAMPKMQEGRGDFLPRATSLALDYLQQDQNGFFLMVEGSQIDWGGHDNDSEYIIEETRDFDQTIGVALDFADQHKNTLVIVTADHETGGFSLSSATVFGRGDYRQIQPTFSTGGHSASLIPVFAYGPGSENFNGIYQNNEIFNKMLSALGKSTEQ